MFSLQFCIPHRSSLTAHVAANCSTDINAHSSIPWIRELQKLTAVKLVKKCPAIYELQIFVTVFTGASTIHYTDDSSPHPYPTSLRSILILFSHPSFVFEVVCFLQAFLAQNLVRIFNLFHVYYTPHTSHTP